MTKYKRLNFVIEKQTYLDIKRNASQIGVPVSKLINTWINNFNNTALNNKQLLQGKITTYNFYLNTHTYNLLQDISKAHGLKVSSFLRSLINFNLNHNHGKSNNDDQLLDLKISRLWKTGYLSELYSVLHKDAEKLTAQQMTLLARVSLESGRLSKISDISDLFSRTFKDDSITTKIASASLKLVESEALLVQGKHEVAQKILHKLLNSDLVKTNSFLYGNTQFQLGLLASKNKDVKNGNIYMQKAIESFNISNNPIELAKSYLYMTDFLEYNREYFSADQYFQKSKELFSAIGNEYYLGWVIGGNAYSEYVRGNFSKAKALANKAIIIDVKHGSKKQQSYSIGVLGRTLLTEEKFNQAISLLEKSLNLQKQVSPSYKKSTAHLLTLLAKSRYEPAYIDRMKELTDSKEISNQSKKLLLYTAQYLFADKNEEAEKGKRGLQHIFETSPAEQLKNAAISTLREKKIQPFAI